MWIKLGIIWKLGIKKHHISTILTLCCGQFTKKPKNKNILIGAFSSNYVNLCFGFYVNDWYNILKQPLL